MTMNRISLMTLSAELRSSATQPAIQWQWLMVWLYAQENGAEILTFHAVKDIKLDEKRVKPVVTDRGDFDQGCSKLCGSMGLT